MTSTSHVTFGIHTFSIFVPWRSYAQVQNVIDAFIEQASDIQLNRKGKHSVKRTFKSSEFWNHGIRIVGSQNHGFDNGVTLIVNPSVILIGEYDPYALASFSKKDVTHISDVIHVLLKKLGCKRPKHLATVSRVDFTCNIECQDEEEISTYLKIFHQCSVNDNYRPWYFENGADGISDSDEANAHSSALLYKEGKSKSKQRPSIKLYDKSWEVSQRDEQDSGSHILRLEYTLPRRELLKKIAYEPTPVDEDDDDWLLDPWIKLDERWLETDFEEILLAASEYSEGMLQSLMKHQFPCTGTHRQYQDAVTRIKKKVPSKKKQEEMLTLLEHMKRCKNLGSALEKMGLSKKRQATLLERFDMVDVHPVCLPPKSNLTFLESLHGRLQ